MPKTCCERTLPKRLVVTEDHEIGEMLDVEGSMTRILLHPSQCYLDKVDICLEDVIQELVSRYNAYKEPEVAQ